MLEQRSAARLYRTDHSPGFGNNLVKPNNLIIACLCDSHTLMRIEDAAKLTPELTLREVFHAWCYLSRKGKLRLIVDGRGRFAIRQRYDRSPNHRRLAS
jgi:hypothetical protein